LKRTRWCHIDVFGVLSTLGVLDILGVHSVLDILGVLGILGILGILGTRGALGVLKNFWTQKRTNELKRRHDMSGEYIGIGHLHASDKEDAMICQGNILE
jgi:hypothetical protein